MPCQSRRSARSGLILIAVIALAIFGGWTAAPAASLPDVFGVSPRNGSTEGGFTVSMTGSGFTSASAVSVGRETVQPTVHNDGFLTFTAPRHAAGVVHLRVATPAGTSLNDPDDDFTYVADVGATPVVLGIAPSSGPAAGGTVITITGQNLGSVQYVDFDGQHVIPSSAVSTQLVVTSPAHAAGIVHLRVMTDAGMSGTTSADDFAYLNPPVITDLLPESGPSGGGTEITILGSGLSGTFEVLFGDVAVAPLQVTSTTVVAYTPAHAVGVVDVRVRNNGGTSAVTGSARYTFVQGGIGITSVSPVSGPTSGGAIVTLTGYGLAGVTGVRFGDEWIAPSSVTGTRVVVTAPPHAAGALHLRVRSSIGVSPETTADVFTYVPGVPVVLGITPRTGPVEGGTVVTLTGTGFTGATLVWFGAQSLIPTSVSETQITVVSPAHAAGLVHLRVVTQLGTSPESVRDDFTYAGILPQVTSIAPHAGPTSGGTVVSLGGTGFAGATGVVVDGQVVIPATVSDTLVTVVMPARAAGIVHLRVVTPAGISPETANDDYTYSSVPVVLGINPTSGSVDGGTDLTIRGYGFTGVTAVSFGDSSVIPYQVTDTEIHLVTPRATNAGLVHLHVRNDAAVSPDTAADNFTYVSRPIVSAVIPSSGTAAGGTFVVIKGVGFSGTTSVSFGGASVIPQLVTDTEIQVVSPAHAPGLVHLRITSTGGTSPDSVNDDFTYVPGGPPVCPAYPFWLDDLAYGSPGGGFYWDPISGLVWTAQRGWHLFAPQPPRSAPQPLWTNALTYGSRGGGFYWDPVSGLVWTAERGWHQ